MEKPQTRKRSELTEILIVRITPQFLERGHLWFSENLASIKTAIKTSSLWSNSAVIFSRGMTIKPSEILRTLTDFGYEKSRSIFGKGEFAWQGNLLDVWPINTEYPVHIEFFGNEILEITHFKREDEHTGPKPSHRASIEKLKEGNFVVHIDHGIGIFRGITIKNISQDIPAYTSPAEYAYAVID